MPHHRLYTAPPKGHGPPPGDAIESVAQRRLSEARIGLLRGELGPALLLPGDAGYPTQRFVFNKRYRPRPLAIVNVRNAADLRTCLAFCRSERLPLRLRGGGHNFAGYSAGPGIVVDLSLLDAMTLDPAAGEVVVGGGCPQGELATLLAGTGWQLPLGDWPSVGIGGFMQGGGYGACSRSLGLNLDHVIAMRVMLASGRVVSASASVNPDLWWAVRGGTGNMFGIVLEIRYRLTRAPEQADCELAFPIATAEDRARAADVLLAIQSGFMRGNANPRTSITCMALHGLAGAAPAMIGPWLVVGVDHLGSTADMNAALAPLLALPGRIADFDFAALNRGITIPPLQRASRYVSRDLGRDDFRALLDHYVTAPSPLDTLYLQALGGTLNTTPRDSSAFIHRNASFLAYLDVFWQDEAEEPAALAWQRGWCATMAPFWNGHCYQNFADPTLADYRHAYWGEAFPALLAVKRKYDPGGLFHFPQMLRPRPGDPNEPPVWPPAVVAALAQPIRHGDD